MTALSRSDGDYVTVDDLVEGSQLLMMNNRKSYPVLVLKVVSALGDGTTERKGTFLVCNIILVSCFLNIENCNSG